MHDGVVVAIRSPRQRRKGAGAGIAGGAIRLPRLRLADVAAGRAGVAAIQSLLPRRVGAGGAVLVGDVAAIRSASAVRSR